MNREQKEQIQARAKTFLFDLLQENRDLSLGDVQTALLEVEWMHR
jgi:hypothetical protein